MSSSSSSSSKTIPLHIELFYTRKIFSIDIEETDTIRDLKEKIESTTGTPVDVQRLICEGRALVDGEKIEGYNIQSKSKIFLLYALRGGGKVQQTPGFSSTEFVDVSNEENMRKRSFTSTAPSWRRCMNGFNFEGECKNKHCPAFGDNVIVPMRFGFVEIVKHGWIVANISCPICKQDVKPTTCGFSGCKWKYVGKKNGEDLIQGAWKVADADGYHTFDTSQGSGMASWHSLSVVTLSLDDNTDGMEQTGKSKQKTTECDKRDR